MHYIPGKHDNEVYVSLVQGYCSQGPEDIVRYDEADRDGKRISAVLN